MSFDALYKLPEPNRDWNGKGEGTNWKQYTPYLTKEDAPKFRSMHWGQRKLFLTEIMFFALHGQENTHVIYAGAAPGQHIQYLSNLFPTYHFDLVDPEVWNIEFSKIDPSLDQPRYQDVDITHPVKINDKITVWHGYFTNDLANMLGKKYEKTNVMFISDIRETSIEESADIEERNERVQANMNMQMEWFHIINSFRKEPVWGMFKFKVVFEVPTTTYLRGDIYYQPWAPLVSPELRLITNAKVGDMQTYNNRWIEQHLRWYNEVQRNSVVERRDPKLNDLWDTRFEYDIFRLFTEHPVEFMRQLSEHLQSQKKKKVDRDVNGKFCFQDGYIMDVGKQDFDISKIVEKNIKYTLYPIVTNLADLPYNVGEMHVPTNITLEQLGRTIITLMHYDGVLTKYTKVLEKSGNLLFVDITGDNIDGKRYIAADLVNKCYPKSEEEKEITSQLFREFDLEHTLYESLLSLDAIAAVIGKGKRKMDGRHTYQYLYKMNSQRLDKLLKKILDISLSELPKNLFDREDIEILKYLMTKSKKKHEVEASYKLAALEKLVQKENLTMSEVLGDTHLDFGGGDGKFSLAVKAYKNSIKTVTLDISRWGAKEHTGKYKEEGVEYVFVDDKRLPFADATFDFISAIQVLHHIDDQNFAISELYRVLKPGGYLFLREHLCKTLEDWVTINLEHMLYDAVVPGDLGNYYNYHAHYFGDILEQLLRNNRFTTLIQTSPAPPSQSYYLLCQKR